MVGVAEMGRRLKGRVTHRLDCLPILALSVHSACNCRCVMCDIWKANNEKREISPAELERHVASLRALNVQRVMLTGGEPLLHRNLWALCARLRAENIRITLVTTGLLLVAHIEAIVRNVDELVISIDGNAEVHNGIRRVAAGFERIDRGLQLLHKLGDGPRVTVRSVIQRANHSVLAETAEAVRALGVDRLSFLAADVTSTAFNRAEPWNLERQAEIALSREQLVTLRGSIRDVEHRCREAIDGGFIVGGMRSLWRIYDYFAAVAGVGPFPEIRCNAPWVSAVLEPGGQVRPCFFHAPYQAGGTHSLAQVVNGPAAVAFRASLEVMDHPTCRRCVCSLSLPIWADA